MRRKADVHKVVWSETAGKGISDILEYLRENFSIRERQRFFTLLMAFEKNVIAFPFLYPATRKSKQVRRAVLSKELSVVYVVKKERIEVVWVVDTRQNRDKSPY
jgi:plasmid stabilization system protein ParE